MAFSNNNSFKITVYGIKVPGKSSYTVVLMWVVLVKIAPRNLYIIKNLPFTFSNISVHLLYFSTGCEPDIEQNSSKFERRAVVISLFVSHQHPVHYTHTVCFGSSHFSYLSLAR